MHILGISCFYHDSAAVLLKDGVVVAAVEEERFTREKHSSGFPQNAVEYCLQTAGINAGQLDYVAYYENSKKKFDRIISTHMRHFPHTYHQFKHFAPIWLKRNMRLEPIIRQQLDYTGPIVMVDHHASHAAGAFFPSGFKKAAILTIDGVGEWATTTRSIGEGNKIRMQSEIRFPHSLGLLYAAVTSYLGFKVNNGEGKVMGLASYGQPVYTEKFKKIIDVKDDGSFRLNMDYFQYHTGMEMVNETFDRLFQCSRMPESEITKEHQDMAASLQHVVENTLIKMAKDLREKTGLRRLCMGGGVALNSVANGKILKEAGFEEMFIQPAASDAGGALGAALYTWCCKEGNESCWKMTPYTGHEADNNEVEACLKEKGIEYEVLGEEEIIDRVAEMISKNKIVGWYQGRMEFGPRALGNRSILANPANPDMKDILNSRVKFRESFRPYAASVLYENTGEYFDCDYPSPFMLLVYNVKEDKKSVIPAVTHVDGTCRIQSVKKNENPLYHRLINAFYKKTGIPMVLNTSFNVRGEPIIMNAKDAADCFLNTGMDALAACRRLIVKKGIDGSQKR